MRLLGYGEDALTLWSLTHGGNELLRKLGDASDPKDILAIHRPSFGRRGRGTGAAEPQRRSAQFGEFDAIVATPEATYLVESTWSLSGVVNGLLTLRPEQRWRHEIMRWYIQEWHRKQPESWTEFASARGEDLSRAFPFLAIAPPGSTLARNLEFVLRLVCQHLAPVQDVLLFACTSGAPVPERIDPASFQLVCMEYPTVGERGFVELSASSDLRRDPPSFSPDRPA